MWRGPGAREDAKNLALIGGSACVAALVTAGFLGLSEPPQRVHVVRHVVTSPNVTSPTYELVEPLSGTNRLYGTVHTRRGSELTGFLRWDRNEGSWSDLLDATKVLPGNNGNISGIRFGHIQRIEALNRNSALFTLRSGEEVRMSSGSSDLGSGLRALIVTDPAGGRAELEWRDLDVVEFKPVPPGVTPNEGRLHGTLTTQSGFAFTGYITWDVDEIYSTDELDGEANGRDYEIPFGAIASISRESSRSARVLLHSGEELVLSGSNDVDRRNSGISVSDPTLGQVKVRWKELDNVSFHGAPDEVSLEDFDGGAPIFGTVVTESGDEIEGEIRWDRDEARTWEMLNGEVGGVDFQIELSQIARIQKESRGSRVTLKDGRTFDLFGSNDVDRENRGIVVESGGQAYVTEWDDFRELRLR